MKTMVPRAAWWLGFSAMSAALFVSPAHADDACMDKAQTQAQMSACAAADLKQADARLNQLYKQMQARLKADAPTGKLLVDAQKKWLAFRDAECSLRTVRSAGGSMQPMNASSCVAELTAARAKDFEDLLACSGAGDEQARASCAIPGAR
jgi:uncharacterized protein YecT (DUF1311 family)